MHAGVDIWSLVRRDSTRYMSAAVATSHRYCDSECVATYCVQYQSQYILTELLNKYEWVDPDRFQGFH